jgi:hypothetical protein
MAAPRSESADDLSFLWRPGTRGLTRTGRPLYSGGFAPARVWLSAISPCGGIGRRARLKIEFRKECWFDSGQGHQSIYGQGCGASSKQSCGAHRFRFQQSGNSLNCTHTFAFPRHNVPE